MSPRARILSYGTAALLVVAGVSCAVAIGGGTGQMLALVLIGLGLVLATGLAFMEVGLSEDRQLAREEHARTGRTSGRVPRTPRLNRPDLGRSRDHPRRLR